MEDHNLQVFENKAIMKLVEPKEYELSKHFRIMHSWELCDLYGRHFCLFV